MISPKGFSLGGEETPMDLQGSLTVLTNDEDFKRIILPVRGEAY